MKRLVDLLASFCALILISPIFIIILLLCYFDTGSPLFVQKRVGKRKRHFYLYKFRSMKLNTVSKGTHLVDPNAVTGLGKFIRRVKLDELPQLINVIKGEMSLVGPRPCLPSQTELIKERDRLNVYNVRPGITGLSQINGIDMSTPVKLAASDASMVESLSILDYFKYIILTVFGRGMGDRINS